MVSRDEHRNGGNNCPHLSVDLLIDRLAARQHGAVSRQQLKDLGLDRYAIRYRLRVGRLFKKYDGVYSVGRRDLTPLGELSAALLRCGEDARLVRWSAAQRLGWAPKYRGPVQISVPRTAPKVKGIETFEAHLHPYDVRRRDGLAHTSAAMTLIDLAPELDGTALAKLFQKALRFGLTAKDLDRTLARYPRRPGTPKLKAILEKYRGQKGRSRGDFEDAVWVWLLSVLPPDVERPQRNALVELGDGDFREGDAVFSKARVWLEFDYHGHHGADPAQAMRDAQRDRLLRRLGWDVGRYSDHEFDNDRPAIEADVRSKLGF